MTFKDQKEKELTITRVFEMPRKLVWKAWTDSEYLTRWWGPRNFTTPYFKTDLNVGGKYLYCMKSAEGQEVWATGTYKDYFPFELIVFTDSFSDDKGNVIPASYYNMPGNNWPLELMVTVKFEDIDNGTDTKMTLVHTGLPDEEMKEMCSLGWNESFDKLNEILK